MTNQNLLDEFREHDRQIRLKHTRQAQYLARFIRQRQAEDTSGCFVLSFWANNYQGVALVQVFEDSARVNCFSDIGPMSHSEVKDLAKLANELRERGYNPAPDPNAGQMVEYWSKRPRWSHGLVSMQVVAIHNLLGFYGKNDQAREIWVSRNIALGYQYCRELGIQAF